MNRLGFSRLNRWNIVDPISFFLNNIPAFIRIYGINIRGVRCTVSCMENNCFMLVRINKAKTFNQTILSETTVVYDMIMEINPTFLESLNELDLEMRVKALWYNLGEFLRIWVIKVDKIPMTELVPAIILFNMPDTKEMIEAFYKMYESGTWRTEDLFNHFDAAAVGLHLVKLMGSSQIVRSHIQAEEVAEVIFSARRSNWHNLTSG